MMEDIDCILHALCHSRDSSFRSLKDFKVHLNGAVKSLKTQIFPNRIFTPPASSTAGTDTPSLPMYARTNSNSAASSARTDTPPPPTLTRNNSAANLETP